MDRKEQIDAGAAALEAEGNDFTFGKPDVRDLVWIVSRAAGLGEPSIDNDAGWLSALDAANQWGLDDRMFAAVTLGFLDAEYGVIRPVTPRQAAWMGAANRAAIEENPMAAALFHLISQPNEAERG